MTDKMLNWAVLGTVVLAEAAIVLIYGHFMKKMEKQGKEG